MLCSFDSWVGNAIMPMVFSLNRFFADVQCQFLGLAVNCYYSLMCLSVVMVMWGFVPFFLILSCGCPVHRKAPAKKNKHRALDDIRESILELKFYKENIFKTSKEIKRWWVVVF